jgi:hypothetical protein
MTNRVQAQWEASTRVYSDRTETAWDFHYTSDPLIRYLRDRRLRLALKELDKRGRLDVTRQSVLLVCGGVGGEGTFLANQGFADVTVSDLSEEALKHWRRFDGAAKDESLECGRHDPGRGRQLRPSPRTRRLAPLATPRLGLHGNAPRGSKCSGGYRTAFRTGCSGDRDEMGKWSGTQSAMCSGGTEAFSNRPLAVICLDDVVIVRRFFDHNLVVGSVVGKLPHSTQLFVAKGYLRATLFAAPIGNMMVGMVLKPFGPSRQRLVAH